LARRPGLDLTLVEAGQIGSGASGASGGIALEGTAVGDHPDFGGCLAALERVVREEQIDGELDLSGCWVVRHNQRAKASPIEWNDAGLFQVVDREPGGPVDVGALLGGLFLAVERRGGRVYENTPLSELPRASQIVLAADAAGLALAGVDIPLTTRITYALALEGLDFEAAGWGERRAFYTGDLPYLWGRPLSGQRAMLGGGWSAPGDEAERREVLARLEERARGLHPAFAAARITERWGGPMSFTSDWQPVFGRIKNVHFAAGYAGHGVALAFRVAERIADAVLVELSSR
jgi:glycine/D-amino acid oxidase-like deaminating enzyme